MTRCAAVLLGDLNMLRCFAHTDVPIVVATTDPDDITLASRHAKKTKVIAPFTEEDRALADLEAIAAEHDTRPVLFYGNDEQLLFISRHRDRLERSFRFRMPSASAIETFVDKQRFADFARACGLPVPAQIESPGLDRRTSPEAVLATVGLPCVIKPAVHIGWFAFPRKAIVCTTEDELRAAWADVQAHDTDFVIQRYIAGGEDHVYSFHAYVDAGGEIVRWYVGRKVRTYPREAGVSTLLELVDDPAVAKLGFEVIRDAGVIGPVKLDFKRDDATGRLYLLEINARFNLWHRLGTAAGINLPLAAYDELSGEAPHEIGTHYATDVRWLAFGDDLRSFLRSYHPDGLGWGEWLKTLRGKKVYDIFAIDDPLPFLANAARRGKATIKAFAQRVTS